MTQTFDLNKMGVVSMDGLEMLENNGGDNGVYSPLISLFLKIIKSLPNLLPNIGAGSPAGVPGGGGGFAF
ncbi:MAG: hypothetical protein ABI707_15970 [Ferruginibacter sp.]